MPIREVSRKAKIRFSALFILSLCTVFFIFLYTSALPWGRYLYFKAGQFEIDHVTVQMEVTPSIWANVPEVELPDPSQITLSPAQHTTFQTLLFSSPLRKCGDSFAIYSNKKYEVVLQGKDPYMHMTLRFRGDESGDHVVAILENDDIPIRDVYTFELCSDEFKTFFDDIFRK